MKKYLLASFLLLGFVSNVAVTAGPRTVIDSRYRPAILEKYVRTELYFGRNMPSGGTVSDADWQAFVDEFVTPRFPDGLTILDADGQWRGKDGTVAREQSKVIVLLYPRKMRKAMNVKIEEIRAEYKKQFAQEAVMRIDITKSVEVTF